MTTDQVRKFEIDSSELTRLNERREDNDDRAGRCRFREGSRLRVALAEPLHLTAARLRRRRPLPKPCIHFGEEAYTPGVLGGCKNSGIRSATNRVPEARKNLSQTGIPRTEPRAGRCLISSCVTSPPNL